VAELASARPVAVVTGAAAGIGAATVDAAIEAGFGVVAMDIDAHGLAARRWPAEHVRTAVGDARSSADVDEACRGAATLGRFAGFVANAGISRPGASIDYPMVDWAEVIDLDLTAVFLGCRIAARHADGALSIVAVSSVAGLRGFAGRAAYAAAKAGVIGLVMSLAVEWAPLGIRVNAVAPGYVATELVRENIQRGVLDPSTLPQRIPAGRLGTPDEVGSVVAFLLGSRAAYVTGAVLPVDGGFNAYGMPLDAPRPAPDPRP
jgi:3-oxoacyl-[acyl-carrier protein] reductase